MNLLTESFNKEGKWKDNEGGILTYRNWAEKQPSSKKADLDCGVMKNSAFYAQTCTSTALTVCYFRLAILIIDNIYLFDSLHECLF